MIDKLTLTDEIVPFITGALVLGLPLLLLAGTLIRQGANALVNRFMP